MKKIECIIMDWAGTAVDYGCFAPVAAFIEAFADKHEIIYVELLFAAYKNDRSRVFHRVHSQIGAYLSENQEKLDIKKTRRLMTRNPFGRENEVQEWRKKE